MKAVRAYLFLAAFLAATTASADPVPAAVTSPAPAASTQAGVILAPPSVTSAAVLMARAFRPRPESCESRAPGVTALLIPSPINQVGCMLSPFYNNKFAQCPAFPAAPVIPLKGNAPPVNQQPSYVVGDNVESQQNSLSVITGNVQLDQGDRRVTSQKMTYDDSTGLAVVEKDVGYYSPKMMLGSPTGKYDTNSGTGSFDDADFLLPQRNGHGTAKLFNSLDDTHSQLFGTTYTTCPPGNTDWMLTAPDMNLDTGTNTGEAYDVTIHFMGWPIFWSPYLNFPLSSDRKSGFIGGNMSFDVINGIELSAPYYLDLADNYDATLYPRIVSKRGVETGAQFRWLTPINSGFIYGDLLPHDQVADRERSQFQLRNTTSPDEFNTVSTVLDWVSDDNYFHDLDSDLVTNSSTILPRFVRYNYDDEADWAFMSQFQDWQVINPFIPRDAFVYRRLPQITVDWGNNLDTTGPQYTVHGEAVRFQRELRVGAWRTDIEPSVSLPVTSAGAYFTPTLAWRLTDYDLSGDSFGFDRNTTINVGDRHLSRSLPLFDIDTGMFFQRDGANYSETLEPRLYYLRVPYRDQHELPIFDSLQPEFGYVQLFSNNLFYGADRQSDANQLSYALTTRVLDSLTGAQVFQADIGQIRFFADRKVQFNPTAPPDTSLYSDVTGDVLYNINDVWSADYSQLWNPTTRQTDLANVLLEYHPGYHEVVNIAYLFRRPKLKQTDVSFAWPLAGNWSWVGHWTYDVVNHINLEELWGFEYDSCCWNFQFVHRHYLMPTQKYDNVFFFEFQLKGLGTAGRHLEDLLQRGILGYSDNAFNEPLQTQGQPTSQ